MPDNKKRLIKSLDNLSEDQKELIKTQYPNGYESNITRIVSPKKEQLFVFPLETDDAIILVKIPVTKNSDGGYDMEKEGREEFDEDRDDIGGDDDSGDEDSDTDGGSDDDYESGGGKRGREGSYDPDFDN